MIGDGALTGGMALEALNDAGVYKKGLKLLIILNDNDCSISPPVGALSSHLAKIVSTRTFMNARELSKKVLKPVPGLWEVAKSRRSTSFRLRRASSRRTTSTTSDRWTATASPNFSKCSETFASSTVPVSCTS